MKRWIAFLLCLLLALSLAACGSDKSDKPDKKPTQISVKPTTETEDTAPTGGSTAPTEGESTAPTATAPTGSVATDSTASATGSTGSTTTTATTEPAPSGVTVPIGTRPPTTTTSSTTGSATATGGTTTGSTDKPTTTTTTTTTTKPTQPPEEQLYLVLPAVGSDIDVAKKKGRIHVSATAAWFNEDGTIGVSLTFKNNSSNWITEETDYILYTCYDKDGNVIERVKLSIGVIDTKKNYERTYTLAVPAHTAEVRITGSKITYWTEWA